MCPMRAARRSGILVRGDPRGRLAVRGDRAAAARKERNMATRAARAIAPDRGRDRARILIADGDGRVRLALASLFRAAGPLDVVGAVATAAAARAAVALLRPDVVVLDPHLPTLADGLALVRRLSAFGAARTVVISASGAARTGAGPRRGRVPGEGRQSRPPARPPARPHRRRVDARAYVICRAAHRPPVAPSPPSPTRCPHPARTLRWGCEKKGSITEGEAR
jgi:CheY-like chemotaxis protein